MVRTVGTCEHFPETALFDGGFVGYLYVDPLKVPTLVLTRPRSVLYYCNARAVKIRHDRLGMCRVGTSVHLNGPVPL
jgi:hypothetical protein